MYKQTKGQTNERTVRPTKRLTDESIDGKDRQNNRWTE